MEFLDHATILEAEDLKREPVEVPEWGGRVFVRTMTGAERDAWEAQVFKGDGEVDRKNFRARLLVRTIVGETGDRIFADNQADALGRKSFAVLDRLFRVAQRLNGIGADAEDELEKN